MQYNALPTTRCRLLCCASVLKLPSSDRTKEPKPTAPAWATPGLSPTAQRTVITPQCMPSRPLPLPPRNVNLPLAQSCPIDASSSSRSSAACSP
jgi:hypothetical protein